MWLFMRIRPEIILEDHLLAQLEHIEDLNNEAVMLAATIKKNFEELGI